jgi:uncharacterized protein (TIGR02145 family)
MKRHLTAIIVVLALLQLNIYSQIANPIQSQKKFALVIGNGTYQYSSLLANPVNDATAMKVALENSGFIVLKYENLTQNQMKKAIDDFGDILKGCDIGLFFYAGHGIQSKGYNYLIPVDAQLQNEQEIEYNCVEADRVLAKMETSGTTVNILILDACRNNPFERSWTRSTNGRGLAFMNAPSGTLIAYATSPGTTASDGSGNNGLYTSAILESMKIPNMTIIQMFQNVRSIVSQKSGKQQIPWESTSLIGDLYINPREIINNPLERPVEKPIEKTVEKPQDNLLEKPQDKSLVKVEIPPTGEADKANENEFFIDFRDQEKYKTVKIGTQVWMAENLRTTQYNDKTYIPLQADEKLWRMLKDPSYCWYNNDWSDNKLTYGTLYNWYTVSTTKLCPVGWHVPSLTEWKILIDNLGGPSKAGTKLKETGTNHWKTPNSGATNPGGYRDLTGSFVHLGLVGQWWTCTIDSKTNSAWYQSMDFATNYVTSSYTSKSNGLSVRCIKDL